MEIDFHFGVTYVVSRLAGLSHNESEIVATCAQYVDDTVVSGVVNFETGQKYSRISSAHEALDYLNLVQDEDLHVWLPFHFLPGNSSEGPSDNSYHNKIICRPNSPVAKAMLRNCIRRKSRPFGLHQAGVTAHVFVDTWAHQGFAGIYHQVNYADEIKLDDDNFHSDWKHRLKTVYDQEGYKNALKFCKLILASEFAKRKLQLGHGIVLHYPDQPYRKWSYKNGHGEIIIRDNPTDFIVAADELCKFLQRFQIGDPDASVSGLPENDRQYISDLLRNTRDPDPSIRLKTWLECISSGLFSFGKEDVRYYTVGPESWKVKALGEEQTSDAQLFKFQPQFLKSNWKLFHDAAQAHRIEILHEILPQFGICAI